MIGRIGRGAWTTVRTFRDAVLAVLVAALICALIGQVLRDSVAILSPLMYIPPIPLVSAALLVDALRRGRTLRGPRFSLALLALLVMGIHAPSAIGLRSLDATDPATPSLRLLQWNVRWGGSWDEPYDWPEIGTRILSEQPDLIVLSEAPSNDGCVELLTDTLGPQWQVASQTTHSFALGYLSRMRLICRFPVSVEYTRQIPTGAATVVRIETDPPMRLMMCDGISGPGDKSHLLRFFADLIERDGTIDIVAGDFNALGQSRGFSRFRSAGFREASAHDFTLRSTWPAGYPTFSIDHVFVRTPHRLVGVHTFDGPSDHRGQVVDFQLMR